MEGQGRKSGGHLIIGCVVLSCGRSFGQSVLQSGQAFDLVFSWVEPLCSIRQTLGPVLGILVKIPLSPCCRVSVSENKLQNKVTKTANSIETRYPPATVLLCPRCLMDHWGSTSATHLCGFKDVVSFYLFLNPFLEYLPELCNKTCPYRTCVPILEQH